VKRVAATDTFVAYQPQLEDVILPQSEDLYKAMVSLAHSESRSLKMMEAHKLTLFLTASLSWPQPGTDALVIMRPGEEMR